MGLDRNGLPWHAVGRMAAGFVGAVLSAAVSLSSGPALASDGAKAGGNGCPWAQDVTLEVNGKALTINQSVFTAKAIEPTVIDGYKLFPEVDQLKLRIVGPRGREWEAALTRLAGGKRCNAFYVGKAVAVTDTEQDPNMLILNR